MADFNIKRNDTARSIEATLKDTDGNAVDLTGASVKFLMSKVGKPAAKVDTAATIVDAANGKVRHDWQAADTDTDGSYQAEWEVTYGDSTVETFPSSEYVSISIDKDLG